MSKLRIGTRDERRSFRPGEEITGAAGWEMDKPPQAVEVRLIWFTRGKGTEDVGLVETVRFDQPKAAEARPVRFVLPAEPCSFSGRLISLRWALELVALPDKQSARLEFVLGPEGREVVLPHAPEARPDPAGSSAKP
jgi:hypothetical protein